MQNLEDYQPLISALMKDRSWRERVVEEFVFGAGEHVRVSSTFQFGLAEAMIEHYLPGALGDRVRLLLPVTTRDKRALLNFDLRGPERQDSFLLTRAQIGVLQARYLLDVFADAGLLEAPDPKTADLLVAICMFTPARFDAILTVAGDQDLALARYLSDGLAFAITPEEVGRWRQRTSPLRQPLLDALQEPASAVSSAEEVLLALPVMVDPPQDADEIATLLDRYCMVVEGLSRRKATDALLALADSGRRWIAIAELTVPVGERFAVYVSEDRRLELRGKQSRQRFALGDASSAHLEVRVADANVHIGRGGALECHDPLGETVEFDLLEDARFTSETSSLYSSVEGRPRFLDVYISLRLTGSLRAMPWLMGVLAAAAVVIGLLLPAGRELITSLAVLVVPITVAAALLAIREQTALASRLQTWPRRAVVVTTMVLWSAVLLRLLWGGAELPPWDGSNRPDRQTLCGTILDRSKVTWIRNQAAAGPQKPSRVVTSPSRVLASATARKPACGTSAARLRGASQTSRRPAAPSRA
jgi:hypothetical protein